jgi:tyrosine-protein phosphatase YwqE
MERNEKEKILEKSAKEYFYSGNDEFAKERYNSAVVLYFKSLTALVDLYILQKTGDTPSSHTERFRITKDNFLEIYELLDKNFPFYQSSYIQIMTKELGEIIKDDTQNMAEKTKIEF